MASDDPKPILDYEPHPPRSWHALFQGYFWFILKNAIGWLLILVSWPLGIAIPGPGGIPLFLIGFALVTFPGKRRLTSRVLRGRRIDVHSGLATSVAAVLSLLIPLAAALFCRARYGRGALLEHWGTAGRVAIYLAACAASFVFVQLAYRVINLLLRGMPRARRMFRPWMRDRGIRLLPPRRRRRRGQERPGGAARPDEEIIEIHQRWHDRLARLWTWAKPWARRLAGVLIVAAVFYWIFKPILRQQGEHWPQIVARLQALSVWRFVLAALMFSLFLLVIRSTSWRWILKGLGVRLPIAPATRIWCASELARYIPGVIWQVVGRVYLSKPYGVSTSVSSVSQVLELVIFMFANMLVAVCCLLWFGVKQIAPEARPRLITAMAMIPIFLVILHPRIFYPMMNWILRRFHKPQIEQRLTGPRLVGLVLWAILGLLWQSLAIWLLVSGPLGLPLAKWWVVAGAYCLAWTVGFTFGALTPGGIGVREGTFVTTLKFILPDQVRQAIQDPVALAGLLAFLSVLLRLWATAGELLLAAVTHAIDYRGALGRPDAPGRIAQTPAVSNEP